MALVLRLQPDPVLESGVLDVAGVIPATGVAPELRLPEVHGRILARVVMTAEVPACIHHFKLETPAGSETVHGICKFCHAERDFPAAGYDLKYQSWNQGLHLFNPNNAVDAYSLGQAMGDR